LTERHVGQNRLEVFTVVMFEIEPQLITGDIDGDGTVAFAEFLILAETFGRQEASREDGDLNDDQTVDFADFLLFAENFGRTAIGC
jgi:hypothetical protein